MYAPITVYNALKRNIDAVDLRLAIVTVQYIVRTSAISDIKVHCIRLCQDHKQLFTIIEIAVGKQIFQDEFNKFKNATECKVQLPLHILNNKKYYDSFVNITNDLVALVTPESTYSKKDKAQERLNIILRPDLADIFTTDISHNYTNDTVAYDATGYYPTFSETKTITNLFINDHLARSKASKLYKAVYDYTVNSSINASLLDLYYFNKKMSSLPADKPPVIAAIDKTFDYFNNSIITFPDPLIVYRLTRYIDPPRKGTDDYVLDPNLFNMKIGDTLPNICYLSTTWTNKRDSAPFNQESQFKGSCFVITIKTSENIIAIGENSGYPNEKEILLSRHGGIKITDLKYKGIIENCGLLYLVPERLVIYGEFIPIVDGHVNAQNIFVPEIDFTENKTSDSRITEYGTILSRRDPKVATVSRSSCAAFAIKYRNLWDNNDEDSNGIAVKTEHGVVNTQDYILDLLEFDKPDIKTTLKTLMSNKALLTNTSNFSIKVGSYEVHIFNAFVICLLLLMCIIIVNYFITPAAESVDVDQVRHV